MTERTITITANPVTVRPTHHAPAITIFHIVVDEGGHHLCEETFNCVDDARAFLDGFRTAASFGVTGTVPMPTVSTLDKDPEVSEYTWDIMDWEE